MQEAAARGTSYGAPSPLELDLARGVVERMPAIEMVRFVNSGTEATIHGDAEIDATIEAAREVFGGLHGVE